MATKETPRQRLGGTRYRKTARRSRASQARLDAILDVVGNNPEALLKLLCAIAEIAPGAIAINR